MTQTSNNLSDYIRRLGEHINILYERMDKAEEKLNEVTKEITNIKDSVSTGIEGFDEFVRMLTENLKKFVPPIPQATDEKTEQPTQDETQEETEQPTQDETQEETELSYKLSFFP